MMGATHNPVGPVGDGVVLLIISSNSESLEWSPLASQLKTCTRYPSTHLLNEDPPQTVPYKNNGPRLSLFSFPVNFQINK